MDGGITITSKNHAKQDMLRLLPLDAGSIFFVLRLNARARLHDPEACDTHLHLITVNGKAVCTMGME